MTDDTPPATRPRTRRVDPGLTRRLSMGMGTLTLAGAAFFGATTLDTEVPVDTVSTVSSTTQP